MRRVGRLEMGRIVHDQAAVACLRGLARNAAAVGRATLALVLAAATLAALPAGAVAAQPTIAPSGTIHGRQVHSGEGALPNARAVVPLRVADPAAYAREKQRAAQLAGATAPFLASGALGSTSGSAARPAPSAAVFGSLNAAGLSAEQQIKSFGPGADVTPPDTTGAIGPEHYVEFVNSEVAAYKRSNLAIVGTPVRFSTFIAPPGITAICDPQIKYDPKTSRWFYSALRCDGTTTENKLYLGFSKTSNPTDFSTAVGHGWCGYEYSTGSLLEDYDKLGLDSSHIIVGSNAFEPKTNTFVTAHILSLPKPASGKIETCPAAPTLTTFGSKKTPLRTLIESHLASTPQPATVADESASGYIVAADETTPFSGTGSHVMIWQVAGTGETPELKALAAPAVTEYKIAPNAPQPGSTDQIDTLDSRLTQAVAAADPGAGGAEAVWTQHTVAGGAGTVVRWYELVPAKSEVKQAGTISDPSLFVFNGAIAPTLSGGAVINYNTASATALVKIVAQSRLASDLPGTMNTPLTLASSAAIDSDFTCPSVEPKEIACRWGDYAGASVDPNNANVVWGSNQLNGPTAKEHDAQWATQTFALTPVKPPTVVTGEATAVTRTAATLNATVNPNGGEVSECKLEYGTSTSYGSSAPCTPSPGSGTMAVAVSATVSGLTANTPYHFRISATNAGGTSEGADETFKTLPDPPPTPLTAAASSITQTAATLNATVNPNGGEVSKCEFEYGETTTYTKTEKCSSLPGSGTSPVAVSAPIMGLTNKTTYHFRISATGVGGTNKGSDQTFTASSTHVYRNGIVGSEGAIARTIGWGTLKLATASFGDIECLSVSGGYLEDPIGGGSAIGKLQAYFPYECVSASCKAAGGTAIELTPENLPWSTEATEVEGGGFRLRTGNRIKAAGAVFLRVNCVGVKNTQFFAEDVPKILNNGIAIGVAPTEEEFDQPGSGELESEAGGLKFAGKVKFEGYGSQEVIEVKNP